MLVSCDRNSDSFLVSNAVINYTDPDDDGCGWTIKINDESYHLIELLQEFKVDGNSVSNEYKILTTTWNCPFWDRIPIRQINIVDIESISE